MVSKVILITHIYAQLSMVVTFLGNPILLLDLISHGHVTRLLVF